jgi:hypothetical protein
MHHCFLSACSLWQGAWKFPWGAVSAILLGTESQQIVTNVPSQD